MAHVDAQRPVGGTPGVETLSARTALVTLGRKAAKRLGLQTLSVEVNPGPDGKLPREIRLFKAGANPTRKGEFLFDERAADLTMAAYAEHAVDVMVDLEHLSLDDEAPNYDPDARGWGRFELRNDGELWLVDISWTPDGVDRVTTRKQRFVSPAFEIDDEGRVISIFNIGLTAMPATDDAMPLAASVRHQGNNTMDPKLLNETALKIDKLLRAGKPHGEVLTLSGYDAKTIQRVAKQIKQDLAPDAELSEWFKIIQDYAAGLQKMAAGETPEADKPADGAPADGAPAVMRANPAELETLRQKEAVRVEADRKELETLRRKDVERDATERHDLTAALVVCRKFNPPDVWDDDDAKTPQEWIRSMPIEKLRAMVKRAGGTRVPADGPKPQTVTGGGPATPGGIVACSEYEQNRLRATVARENPDATQDQLKRIEERAILRYVTDGPKVQQVRGAKNQETAQRLSRELKQDDVLANRLGVFGPAELVTLSTPLQPIQVMGVSSQRAMEEFRLEFNATLVSQPEAWAESIGTLLPGGSLKDTYPLSFDAIAYAESTGQAALAGTPQSVDISVNKRLFRAAAQAQLIRIQRGDFAYVQQWQQNAAKMARARIALRNALVTTLLEAAHTGYWGLSVELTTGIDGQPFFSATHKVNPFDPTKTFLASATWGNYQASATPLNAGNLTQEKASMALVPAPDGEALGAAASGLLVPLRLKEPARLLLTVQDLILAADVQTSGSGKMGTIRNEHFGSGLEITVGDKLAGSGATANYYLYDRAAIARGLPPWVIAEDATEELLTWDESSDFYRDTKQIKVESDIYINAALLFPHGIRKVKGA